MFESLYSKVMELDLVLWIIILSPSIILIVIHYFCIMGRQLFDWLQGRNNDRPVHQPLPTNPPQQRGRDEKKLQQLILDINLLKTGHEKLLADTQTNFAEAARDSRGFTEHVYQELDKRCHDLERARQRLDHTVDLKSVELERHKRWCNDTLTRFDNDIIAIEKFIDGDSFSRQFIDKLMPYIEHKLQLRLNTTSGESRLPSAPPPNMFDSTITMSPIRSRADQSSQPPSQRNYAPRANIPPPRFNPDHNTADFFLDELKEYFEYSNIAPEDRLCHLSSVFGKEKELNLWWQRTKLQVTSWDGFCHHFMKMYGSTSDYTASLEKLLRRRQQPHESFKTFALEMELSYRKLHRENTPEINQTIIEFISERALPSIKPHLLGCHAKDIYELIQFAQKLEPTVSSTSNIFRQGQKDSYDKNKSIFYNRGVRPPSPKDKSPPSSSPEKGKDAKDQQQLKCKRCGKTNHKTDDCRFNKQRINNIAVDEDRQSPAPSSPVPNPNDGASSSDDEQQSTFMGSFAIFNNNNKNNPLPMIPVHLPGTENNKTVQVSGKCLVDTGASVSVLGDPRLWNGKKIKKWTKGPIKLVDGSTATPHGRIQFTFRLGRRFTHEFVLLPECDFTMLLGMDFLRNSGIIMDLELMQFWYKDTTPIQKYQFEIAKEPVGKIRSLQILHDWQKAKITEILQQFPTVVDSPSLGHTDVIEHEINVKEDKPKLQRPYPVSAAKSALIDQIVDDMLKQGLVSDSNSPYSSPVILRPKPNGDWRLVNDYRYVNQLTVNDGFPMKRIDDMLRMLSEAKYLSTIDLEKGFWQVKLRDSDKKFTAFQTRKGLYHYNVMPQGLKNSPATFQRLMNKVLRGLDAFVFVYQDDILIFSKNFEEHLLHISTVMERLKNANLTIKSDKCQFGRDQVKFLGHMISTKGISRNPEKVKAITELSPPTTRKQLRSFLGAVGWFRHFIPNMASLSEPLYKLLSPKTKFKWNQDANISFEALKKAASSDITLLHPDFNKPFVLRTDASDCGVGAVLLQENEDNQELPIAFASKALSTSQKNYSAAEKECYAVIFALEKFREYLDGATFAIQTDNTAITYLHTMKNTNSRLMRWCWKLQEWSPSISHIKGWDNMLADYLSRNPVSPQSDSEEETLPLINAVTLTCDLDKKMLKEEQQKDQTCLQQLVAQPDKFCDKQGIIYRKLSSTKIVPLIPISLQQRVLKNLHDTAHGGHLGTEKTFQKLKSKAYFKNMRKIVEEYVKTCDLCQRNRFDNKKPQGQMGTKPIHEPWHTLYMDFLGPYTPSTSNRYSYILVIVDGFSKYVELHPTKEATSQSIAKVLEREIFCRYGIPKVIVSDNATAFRSNLMEKLCKSWGVHHSFASAYHPQTNLAERVNRVIKPMIRKFLDGNTHNKWAENIPLFQLAINSSKHESTGYSPAQILFNQEPRLPIDNAIAADTSDSDDHHDDENSILLSRHTAFQKILHDVKSNLLHAHAKQKANYDHHRQPTSLKMNDIVVIRNTTLSNKDKKIVKGLCPLYSSTPGRITRIYHDLTYEVTFQDGTTRGPLHADMLRLYHSRDDATADTPAAIPMVDPSSSEEDSPPVPRQLRQRGVRLNYRDLHLGRKTSI
ncbi:unnamed protein product [Orchesella dallaii]|uniref:RNA-directed DNA polymerase n=1 Tax=Orchesella dallaii TaxID=48710 RepID=A0ABP1Q3F3_9HEXA